MGAVNPQTVVELRRVEVEEGHLKVVVPLLEGQDRGED
jgi:hypothetical protein